MRMTFGVDDEDAFFRRRDELGEQFAAAEQHARADTTAPVCCWPRSQSHERVTRRGGTQVADCRPRKSAQSD
jgi:hypothetical protein